MVLSTGCCPVALLYELPDLVIQREPWHPAWHPGYVKLVYTKRPVEPVLKRRRELCAVAALKRRRYSRPVPATWVHPWCVQTEKSDEKINN